jgi:hypothetical protein
MDTTFDRPVSTISHFSHEFVRGPYPRRERLRGLETLPLRIVPV